MTQEFGGPSIQERFFPEMKCFGCGPANPKGLRLRSYPTGDGTVATFAPWPEHDNGLGFLNGGIICTVMDCHSATPMMLEAERLGLLDEDTPLPFVTAGLEVRYVRPTPLGEVALLQAALVKADANQMTVSVELLWDDKPRAVATAIWQRWRVR